MWLSFQPMRNLTVNGMVTAARTDSKMVGDEGQVAQEAGASIAGDDAFGGAAEVEVDHVEAGFLDDAGGVGEGGGVGAEELGGDGVLVVVEGEVALALGFAHAGEAVGGGELGHDEAAAGLLVGDSASTASTTHVSESRHGPASAVACENRLALRMKRRKTVSVTPAMGARTVAGATVTPPIWSDAGTRVRVRAWRARAGCPSASSSSLRNVLLKRRPPPQRRPELRGPLGGYFAAAAGCRFGFGFGVLAAEALDATRSVDQLLFAGEERVAVGADFRVDVAFVRGAGGEVVAAGADDANLVVIGVNFLFGHDCCSQTFPANLLILSQATMRLNGRALFAPKSGGGIDGAGAPGGKEPG